MREAERRVLSVWKRRTEMKFRPTLPGLSVIELSPALIFYFVAFRCLSARFHEHFPLFQTRFS
jgi:hypothetical protein